MGELKKNFGKRIRQLREAKRLTQKELGIKADMEYQYLGAIERGEKNPSLDFIEKIAVGLELKPYQLFIYPTEQQEPERDLIADELSNILKSCDLKTQRVILEISKLLLNSN